MTRKERSGTGFEAGLSGDQQIRIALEYIATAGGTANTAELYDALEVETRKRGYSLSKQGRASLRYFVNSVAVAAGYIYPFDKSEPGWRATPEGKAFLEVGSPDTDEVLDVDSGEASTVPANVVNSAAFELWVMGLLRSMYPSCAWYHQGRHKLNERGLDFLGERVGETAGAPLRVGVQVKLHAPNNAPSTIEWLKFLGGCFARRTEVAVFITSGRLTGGQRREAHEARVTVIEGRSEIDRLADFHKVERFSLFADEA